MVLSCPEYCHILEEIFRLTIENQSDNYLILKILSDSILTQVSLNSNNNFNWLEKYIDKMLLFAKTDETFFNNFNNLIFSFLSSIDQEKDKEKYQFWIRILLKYDTSIEEVGIEDCLICQYYGGDDIKNYFEDTEYTSLDLDLFDKLVLDQDNAVAENAAKILTYAYPLHMQKKIPFFYEQYKLNNLDSSFYILENSCESIIH